MDNMAECTGLLFTQIIFSSSMRRASYLHVASAMEDGKLFPVLIKPSLRVA